MTAVLNTPDPTATDTDTGAVSSAFADALCEIEYLLDTDPARARQRWAQVLELAKPAEREFLDRAAELFTRVPFKTAARRLGWMAKSRPELRELVIELTADSEPGLYRPLLPQQADTSIEAAEWVRRSIRDQRGRDRLTATPSKATDDARLTAAAITARRDRIPAPDSGTVSLRHRARDRRVTERQATLWAGYAAERLYAIDTEPDIDRTPPVGEPRKRAHQVWAHVQAELWERSYFLHTVANYTDTDRDLLDAGTTSGTRRNAPGGRLTELDARASAFLAEHDTAPDSEGDRPRRSRRPRAQRTPWVRQADQIRFAQRRTGLAVPSDYDERRPYGEIDEPEDTWQGSGLDYDRAALLGYLGWPCVGCWIDRPVIDRTTVHHRDGAPVSDDGLCDVCRADGHPGIPPLRGDWRLGDFVESRCDHIATAHPRQVRAILDRIRAAAAGNGPTWRLIARWMAMNLDQPARPARTRTGNAPRRARHASALGAGQRTGRCDACARNGIIHADGYCTPCRIILGLVPARPRKAA
ncbi:hypothetical protein [Nocardia sp. NPDC057227]|uniref:hypothetical protein n=1 Tax=Nocardia sp. NPDC057227 TaxID=3346056 RepID=UPI00363C15FF